jgi:hypothetical protein
VSKEREDGGAAFPVPETVRQWEDGDGSHTGSIESAQQGMFLRDYFAGQALTALAAGPMYVGPYRIAEEAYHVADAMLEVRAKAKP